MTNSDLVLHKGKKKKKKLIKIQFAPTNFIQKLF